MPVWSQPETGTAQPRRYAIITSYMLAACTASMYGAGSPLKVRLLPDLPAQAVSDGPGQLVGL